MLPGPIFRREVKAASRLRGLFAFRVLVVLLIAAVAIVVLFGPPTSAATGPGLRDAGALRVYSIIASAAAIGIEVFFAVFFAALVVASGIAEEREKDTLPLLLLTRLTRLELATTKLAGRLVPALLLLLTGLPLILVGGRAADLPAALAVEVVAAMVGTILVAGSLGILASSRRDRIATAQPEALFWSLIWLVGLPLVSRLPVRPGTLWGDLLVEIRRLAAWIAPSSPLSLASDPSWLSGASGVADALSVRLLTMLVLQSAVIALALAGAVAGLRLREPHPTSWDPYRGYRPPVGDDPIFWREYELPWRGSRLPTIVIYARQLLVAIRVILLWALHALLLALVMAVPLALAIGAGWFGYYSFREWWGLDAHPAGTPGARDHLNWFIRAASFMLGVTPMIGAGSGTTARIVLERHKKTWEPLLTTPLTGPELLGSKMRVAARGAWTAMRWLIPLWLLGIACGAVHPLGVILAGAGLVPGIWLGLALGIRAAIKPGVSDQSANSTSALWSLALMPVGGLTVVAPLGSAHDLDALRTLDARLPWLAAGAIAAASIAMAALARSLTRRCFERFDDWAGRPHRAGGPAAQAEPRPSDRGAAVAEAPRTSPSAIVK